MDSILLRIFITLFLLNTNSRGSLNGIIGVMQIGMQLLAAVKILFWQMCTDETKQ